MIFAICCAGLGVFLVAHGALAWKAGGGRTDIPAGLGLLTVAALLIWWSHQ